MLPGGGDPDGQEEGHKHKGPQTDYEKKIQDQKEHTKEDRHSDRKEDRQDKD
jgi:hypothetical protein